MLGFGVRAWVKVSWFGVSKFMRFGVSGAFRVSGLWVEALVLLSPCCLLWRARSYIRILDPKLLYD